MSSISNLNSFSASVFANPVRAARRISSEDLPFLAPNRSAQEDAALSSNNLSKKYESTDSTGIVVSEETKKFLATLNSNTASVGMNESTQGYTRSGHYATSSANVPTLSGSPSVSKTAIAYSTGSAVGGSSATLNSSSAMLVSSPTGSFTTNPTNIPHKPSETSPEVDTEAGSRAREEKEKYPKIPDDSSKAEPVVTEGLSAEEEAYVQELKKRDTEVKTHEQAHVSSGGGLTSGISYDYVTGPDGQRYAMGGSVQIDTSPVPGDPDASIEKARKIRAAALAPASPSSQDRAVASAASQMESEARREKIAIAEEEKQIEQEEQAEEKKLKEEAELEEAQKAEEKKIREETQANQSEPIDNSEKIVKVSDMADVIADETIDVSDLIDSMSTDSGEDENVDAEPIFSSQSTSVGDIANNMSSASVPSV